MSRSKLRIALYECERLTDHLPNTSYSYCNLLQRAFDHFCALPPSRLLPQFSHPPPAVSLTGIDVKAGEYLVDLKGEYDGVLISGSLSGVYDDELWIKGLLEEIKRLDKEKIKTCGISFGHQAIAKALGGIVAPNPKGSEVSVRKAWLTDKGRTLLKSCKDSFKLHYHHNDAILSLPQSFSVLAYNNVTQYQALWKDPHFLTFCGHPDYSHEPEVLKQLLEYDRQKGWVHEQLIEHGIDTLLEKTDYEWVLGNMILFYMGKLDRSGN